jgi:hypothetical protein
MKQKIDLKEDEGNVVPFERPKLVALPATEGDDPTNWLRNVTEGYIFHSRSKGAVGCLVAQVLQHFEKTTICFDLLNKVSFCVYTRSFSAQNEKLQVLALIPKEEQEEEGSEKSEQNDNGSGVQV